MTTTLPVPAAQYLRMSTEHQQYSLENQASEIQRYAQSQGFNVVSTYTDAAKSGLVLKYRAGLRQLLKDVVSGNSTFRAILVYDVSRWGRFQDTDEAAHYEFLCKSAGVPVHYCAEQFANDGSLPSLIMKALKRTMAGEYSRELSLKVSAGHKRLTLLGFKSGGVPGYGLRRMLVSAAGTLKQELAFGERKSIATDRVILVPGPSHEIQVVKEIYRMYISERRSLCAIARKLNRSRVPRPGHSKWDFSAIRTILTHLKYSGCAVYGQVSKKLHTPVVKNPKTEWIVTPGAFEPLVDAATFAEAQRIYGKATFQRTEEEMLNELRGLLASEGKLSYKLIKNSPELMAPGTYCNRFGSLRNAYRLIGYVHRGSPDAIETRIRTMAIRKKLIAQIVEMFPTQVALVKPGVHWRSRLRLFNRFTVSVLVARSAITYKSTRRWFVETVRREKNFTTLLARLDEANQTILDMHVLPNINRKRTFQLRRNDSWLSRGTRLNEISQFCAVVEELRATKSAARQKTSPGVKRTRNSQLG